VLAQEAGQLRGEGVPRRNVELVAERVAARLELLDVGLRLLVRRDRVADLLLVGR
jgi:hypothetical protein